MRVWFYKFNWSQVFGAVEEMSVEQFIDLLYGSAYWFIAAGFIAVALYAVYSRMSRER
ncbi:MAG: hypothetical protein QXI19_10870 [Candidatus Caldarchaeum sp.]